MGLAAGVVPGEVVEVKKDCEDPGRETHDGKGSSAAGKTGAIDTYLTRISLFYMARRIGPLVALPRDRPRLQHVMVHTERLPGPVTHHLKRLHKSCR